LARHFVGVVRRIYERHHSPDERELNPRAVAQLCVQAGFLPPQIWPADFFIGPLGWLVPGLPDWVAAPLASLDSSLSAVPILKKFSSSFSLMAVKPA
jgi:hypothetical protein